MARTNAHQRARAHIAEEIRLWEVKEACWHDPKVLIAEINAFDPTTLEHFKFTMFPPNRPGQLTRRQDGTYENVGEEINDPLAPLEGRGDEGWLWQAGLIDWWTGVENPIHLEFEKWSPNFKFDPTHRVFMTLKARQLGVTWCAMALELWYALFRPGSRCVIYSYNEDEAKKAITRAWLMYNSLPAFLRDHVEVITPSRAEEPAEFIKLRHKASGLISSIQALPATKKAGHGETITFAVMDEVAYQDYARQIYRAIVPATGRGDARLALISTANGVGNADNGEGNYFSILYQTMREKQIAFMFAPWNAEPTRDMDWYERVAMKMDEVERNQSYPLTEADAFMLSGALYFDRAAMEHYRHNMRRPYLKGQFVQESTSTAKWMSLRDGLIEIFERPVTGRKYAIAADIATARGADSTSAGVIDLETGALVAELHGKIDGPRLATQLRALGGWYNMARIAPERQGGYGEATIAFLRDGSRGLPPYPNLYRHTDMTKGRQPISQDYGFPMTIKTRPQVITGLAEWLRERQFPWLTTGIVQELGTFAHASTNPSPRALDGCHDDRVMMLGILVEMYRQFGRPPLRGRRQTRKRTYELHPSRSE